MNELERVLDGGSLDRVDEDFSNEMAMVMRVTLMVQAKVRNMRSNTPFEDWSYEEVRGMFLRDNQ